MPRNGTVNRPSSEPPFRRLRNVTPEDLLDSLRGGICPACAGPKHQRQTLCVGDCRKLPPDMKRALYRRLGQGYRESVLQAFAFLKQNKFYLPDQGKEAPQGGGAPV